MARFSKVRLLKYSGLILLSSFNACCLASKLAVSSLATAIRLLKFTFCSTVFSWASFTASLNASCFTAASSNSSPLSDKAIAGVASPATRAAIAAIINTTGLAIRAAFQAYCAAVTIPVTAISFFLALACMFRALVFTLVQKAVSF